MAVLGSENVLENCGEGLKKIIVFSLTLREEIQQELFLQRKRREE